MDTPENRILSILVADEPAAHERLANVVRRRGPAVVSTNVATGETPGLARITVVLRATPYDAEAFRKHVDKLIDVVEATVDEEYVGAQLALLRVAVAGSAQASVREALDRLGARLLRQGPRELVAQLCDLPERIESALAELALIAPTTAMRTGLVAMPA